MSNLVTFHELKVGKRLGLSGAFLVLAEKNGFQLLFQSENSGEKFYLRSQRNNEVKTFKTLDAVHSAIRTAELDCWPLQVFGNLLHQTLS